jgi:hypothetical protein
VFLASTIVLFGRLRNIFRHQDGRLFAKAHRASQGGAKAYLATRHPQAVQIIVGRGIRMPDTGFDALFFQLSVFPRTKKVETDKRRHHQDYNHNGASH